ncbi:MAG: response regulator [bacterium]|nr:response regulator [bacterium]
MSASRDAGTHSSGLLLAVDDREENLRILGHVLEDRLPHICFKYTTDPLKGLAMAAEFQPDVILLDIHMPGMDGIEVCRRLKNETRTSRIPVVLITAHQTTARFRAQALEAGADDFLSKPIDNLELTARIKCLLRIKEAEDRLREANRKLQQTVVHKEAALSETRTLLRTVIEQSPLPIAIAAPDGTLSILNEVGKELLEGGGHTFSDKANIYSVEHDWQYRDADGSASNLANGPLALSLKGQVTKNKELKTVGKNGAERWAIFNAVPIYENETLIAGLAIAQDITQRKLDEEKIKRSLKEKEVLLREIHHRVKNNLQIVVSLLSLHGNRVTDENTTGILLDCKNRIHSIALIHEHFYQSDDLLEIDFKCYVEHLVSDLSRLYRVVENVALEIDVAEISMSINQGIPLGLILNELFTNALKHGFPPHMSLPENARVGIYFKEVSGGLQLTVSDNGVGFPKEAPGTTKFLGLELVKVLTRQLEGELEWTAGEGTTCSITIALD